MLKLRVVFSGGKQDGKFATMRSTKFQVHMEFEIDGEIYCVSPGPITNMVEKTQQPLPNTAIRLVLKHTPAYN